MIQRVIFAMTGRVWPRIWTKTSSGTSTLRPAAGTVRAYIHKQTNNTYKVYMLCVWIVLMWILCVYVLSRYALCLCALFFFFTLHVCLFTRYIIGPVYMCGLYHAWICLYENKFLCSGTPLQVKILCAFSFFSSFFLFFLIYLPFSPCCLFSSDPDMLEVGNGGMTFQEYQSHFSS